MSLWLIVVLKSQMGWDIKASLFLSWGSFCGLKVDREDYKVTEFRKDKKYECSGHIINDSF